MVDLSQTIAPKSDQLNADDVGLEPTVFNIVGISKGPSKEQPVNIHMEGIENRPWRPCLTMRRVLKEAWERDSTKFVGRSIALYRDPKVRWSGQEVGGIRIKAMSHLASKQELQVTTSRNKREIVVISQLTVEKQREPEPFNQTVTPSEVSLDEQINRFAKEFGARLGKGAYAEFDAWWNSNTEIRGVIPETRLTNMKNAIATAIEKGWS